MLQEDFHKQHTEPCLTTLAPHSIPKQIGPYNIDSLHHVGGMSWLYIGTDPATRRTVAIKVLPSNHLKNQEAIDRFLQESHLISLTDHPNIVKLYQEGAWEGGLYIAMEWVHGICLRRFLTEYPLSLKRSLEIILQVAQALKHLHSHGIIHRDLKPENVLISDNGTVKVIDFGIAQINTETVFASSPQVSGTPNYMSPEQKEASSEVSFASDIYSLGVIAYELILGRLCYGIIQTSLLPKHIGKIIHKALALSPSERHKSVDEFIHDLSTYLKSDLVEKDKPRQDKVNELLELFTQASFFLSSSSLPPWSFADIGMAKHPKLPSSSLYYDVFPLANQACLILLAKPKNPGLYSFFPAFYLRGLITALLMNWKKEQPPFPFFTSILPALQELMQSDPLIRDTELSYLYLDPLANQRHFFHGGLGELIHINKKGKTAIPPKKTPLLLLSNPSCKLVEDTKPWDLDDRLIYSSLPPGSLASSSIEPFAAQPLAEFLLKGVKETIEPKVVFSIHRIA